MPGAVASKTYRRPPNCRENSETDHTRSLGGCRRLGRLACERPRHEPGLARRDEIPAAVEAERRAWIVAGQRAQPGTPEVAVVARGAAPRRCHRPLVPRQSARSDKA